MAQNTENLKLLKPELDDNIEQTIPALADNFDKIDTKIKDVDSQLNQRATKGELAETNAQLADLEQYKNNLDVEIERINGSIDYVNETLGNKADKTFVTPLYEEKRAISKQEAIITIETDDAKIEDYTSLFPFLQSRGVVASLAVPPGNIGNSDRMSWSQIKELVNQYGWSVMSHTVNELSLDTLSPEDVDYQCRVSKELIEAQGLQCDHLSYPNGRYNDSVFEIAKKYYLSSGTTNPGINKAPAVSQKLFRVGLHTHTVEAINKYIDDAIKDNGWLIIYTHGNEFSADSTLRQKLDSVITYAKSKNVPFLNHDRAWESIGNIIDLGVYGSGTIKNNFVLSRRGSMIVDGRPLENRIVRINEPTNHGITPSSPITAFAKYAITYLQIDNNNLTGFPENKAGLLITNYMVEWNGYPFQEYHIIRENKIYRRIWDGSWKTWQLITQPIA